MSAQASPEELEAGRGYEKLFVPALFEPWTEHLIDAASIVEGSNVLDIACGTGILARSIYSKFSRTGSIVGLDPAPGMIATASELEPNIEWVLGTAEALPFPDAQFDRVVSQFGAMFFQDSRAALEQMHRVARPDARLALAVWNSTDFNPVYKDIIALLDSEVGKDAGDALRLPYILGDANKVVDLVVEAGFQNASVSTLTAQATFPSVRTMVEAELRGWLPLFDINLNEEKISDVLATAGKRLAKYTSPTGAANFPTSAHIITATKTD